MLDEASGSDAALVDPIWAEANSILNESRRSYRPLSPVLFTIGRPIYGCNTLTSASIRTAFPASINVVPEVIGFPVTLNLPRGEPCKRSENRTCSWGLIGVWSSDNFNLPLFTTTRL